MDKENDFPPGTFEMTKKTEELSAGSNGSVASLISHNQDLASRLNVAISRNIQLEKALNNFKKVHSQYEERFQSARDQVSIHREKEKFLQNESLTLQSKIQKLNAHLELERSEATNKVETLEEELSSLKPYVDGYKKLKDRISNEYMPHRDQLEAQAKDNDTIIRKLQDEKNSLLSKLGEASSHIQTMAQEFKESSEIEKEESSQKINELKRKLDQVQNENIVLTDRNRVLRKEQIEKTELLNRIEEIKKEKEIFIGQTKEEKDNLLLQLSRFTQERDRLKLENHDLKKQWAKTQAEFRSYKNRTDSSQDEVSSLRALWDEKNSKFSDIERMNESLKSQIELSEDKLKLVSNTHEETKQRLRFFFEQLENIYSKQSDTEKLGTKAMEKAFKKAIEPFTDFDHNL